jgi:hypothetical protein
VADGGASVVPNIGGTYIRGTGRVNFADGVSPGSTSVEVDGASPWLGDDAGSLLRDFVRRGTCIGVPGSAAPGDTAPAPGSSGTTSLGLFGLPMSGSPGFSPLPIDWRRVGYEVESTCSQVVTTERLLHKTLVSDSWNILRPIKFSLKEE